MSLHFIGRTRFDDLTAQLEADVKDVLAEGKPIYGYAIVVVLSNEDDLETRTWWNGNNRMQLLGAVAVAQHTLARRVIDGDPT